MTGELSIHQALAAVMADIPCVPKRDQNQAQNFAFRGIDAVLSAVGPVLRRHQVVVLPSVEEVRETTVEVGRNRTPMGHVTVIVAYTFVGPDGSTLTARVTGEAFDSGDKAGSKAMSVAFRTALIQALALPTDEPDPDAQSYERSEPPPPMTASQQSDIAGALAELDEFATGEVRAWWKGQGLPRMDRLTEAQADVVLLHLGYIATGAAS